MQLLIKISDELYEKILNLPNFVSETATQSIRAGTLLPKGHGDLIDRNDLLADSYCIDDWGGNEVDIVDVMTVKMADTIIAADKEYKNETD